MSSSSTKNRIDTIAIYKSLIAVGNAYLPSGSPTITGQTVQYDSTINKWVYVPANGSGLVDLTTNQTVGGIKTFTDVINANAGMHLGSSSSLSINTPNIAGTPEIDILQTALDVPLGLNYGVRIRRPDNLAYAQFGWDTNGFSLYRVNAGVPSSIFTVANGRLTMLQDPSGLQDAATKNYADGIKRKELAGFVPPLYSGSTGTVDSLKTGFVASASSSFNNQYLPSNVFNDLYSTGISGVYGEWVTNSTSNFWIQIQCPTAVRIWKVAVRGREQTGPDLHRIYDWRIDASNDGTNYTTLLTETGVYLGTTMQQFNVGTTLTQLFTYYRLYAVNAESPTPGLSYFQIYVYSP